MDQSTQASLQLHAMEQSPLVDGTW